MTLDDFARINRSTNEGEPMPRPLLEGIYASISRDELKISAGASAGGWLGARAMAGGPRWCSCAAWGAPPSAPPRPCPPCARPCMPRKPAESTADELPSVFWYQLAAEARRPRGRLLLDASSECGAQGLALRVGCATGSARGCG